MTDFKTLIENSTQLPTADTAFDKPQKLPFVAFIDKQTHDGDDFHNKIVTHNLTVEFYAERIDKANEMKLEALFNEKGWKFEKDRTWLSDQKCFETIYSIEFTERV